MPAVFSSPVRLFLLPGKTMLSLCLSGFLRSAACRPTSAATTACPAGVYQPSQRVYTGLSNIDYPLHDKTIVVTRCGRSCLGKKKINFSTVFAGQAVGIKEVHDDIWLVSLW